VGFNNSSFTDINRGDSLINIPANYNYDILLCNFTRINCQGNYGVIISEGNVNITSCIFIGCCTTGNGGIYYYNNGIARALKVENCLFSGCGCDKSGGCFYFVPSVADASHSFKCCQFINNHAGKGEKGFFYICGYYLFIYF
jgi:hypothetical protein